METTAQQSPSKQPLKLPPELAQLDLVLRSGLEAKHAPPHIFEKWDDFLAAVVEWSETEAKKNVTR